VYQLHSYTRYALEGTGIVVPEPPTPADVRDAGLAAEHPGIFPNIAVLTPAATIDLLGRLATPGVPTEAFFFASIAGMPDDVVRRHVELLCTAVRPAVIGL
jgi:hypothetical protein